MISVHEAEKLSLEQIERFLEGHGRGTIRGQHTGGGLRLDRRAVVPAGVCNAGASRPGASAALYREDGGDEPGAGHASESVAMWPAGGSGRRRIAATSFHGATRPPT